MRKAGDFLEPLTGGIKRRKFCTFDIESKDGDSERAGFTKPFLVGIYDPRQTEAFTMFRDEPHLKSRPWQTRYWEPGGCIDKLMCFLLSQRFRGYTIYSHNGGSFDELFLLSWLRKHEDEFGFEIVPVQSSIQKIEVWRLPEDPEEPPRDKWTFLDSMKLLPMGLDRAMKTFGLAGKVLHDLNMKEEDPSWEEYLLGDCKGLYDVLEKTHDMIENKLGGEVGMTAPSTSMKLFRRQYLGRKNTAFRLPRFVHFPGCSDQTCKCCFHDWVRKAYYGGRTELFTAYGKRLHYYDINSSYVAAMKETMPVGNRRIERELDWRMCEKYIGFAECTVTIPEDCPIPPLPFRADSGKLIFPTGTFSGVWDTDELKLILDPIVGGKVEKVEKVVWIGRKPVFGEMMDTLWALRDQTKEDYDEGLSALAKLMGNSLYGKFGMREDRTQIVFRQHGLKEGQCFLCGFDADPGVGLCRACEGSKPADGDEGCEVWYQEKRVEAPYIIPHVAAHITSLARVRLWGFMKHALEMGGTLYYCDTDSIITDAVLPSSKALGALKDEYPGQELEGTFVQPKVYMLEGGNLDKPKVTMKGFPRDLRTKENLEKLLAGETLTYKRLEKVRTLAREGFHRGPQMVEVKKSFKSAYDKRILLADGTTRAVVICPIDARALRAEDATNAPKTRRTRRRRDERAEDATNANALGNAAEE